MVSGLPRVGLTQNERFSRVVTLLLGVRNVRFGFDWCIMMGNLQEEERTFLNCVLVST
jgi:hypothetical protein